MKTVLNRIGLAAPAIIGLVMLGGASANAATKSAEECSIDLDVCYRIACKNEGDWCFKECEKTFMSCGRYGGNGKKESGPDPLKPKGGNVRAPATGSAKDEPKAPPKVNDPRAPTTGGSKADPKMPPKVNDTRAPIGGGVFHPTTSNTGTNSGSGSGTILRSSGAGQPIMKSNGGSGPNSKSGGGLR